MTNRITELIKLELKRQQEGLCMIPSENYVSRDILKVLGTPLTNKYSEGYPDKRYYSGNIYIDEIENIAREKACKLFGMPHANVQPHSGSSANFAAYFALLEVGDTILSLDLNAGAHITHGNKFNFSGKYYNVIHYGVKEDETIDFDQVGSLAKEIKPKLIVSGTTSYPRTLDFERFTKIAHGVGALHMADISHIAGLIIAGEHPSSSSADVVTSTTHKTLRGPRGAIILCQEDFAKKIDRAIFPGTQGGPLDNVVAAKAVCFEEAGTESFRKYQKQIIKNAQALAKSLMSNGIRLVTGGTDNHLIVADLTALGVTGNEASIALEQATIYVNKNVIPFEKRSSNDPSGIRLGTPALTTRGLLENDMQEIGEWISKILKDHSNTTIIESVKKDVSDLMANHPIYEDLDI
ncbi:MAG: serine hydroxymethyltransferase [Patescibacteria group bacterium]|jgi:glycine hydroxymethyltransferase